MGSNKLLIASVTDPGQWYLFDAHDVCVAHKTYSIAGKEFDCFLDTIETFLASEQLKIDDIETIYLVTGPASFTGGRIITLTLGSLVLAYPKLKLVGLTLFEYWAEAGNQFPMAVEANREEVAIQKSATSDIELISKAEAEHIDFHTWFARIGKLSKWGKMVQFETGIPSVSHLLKSKSSARILHPLYIKKPNITFSPTSYDTSRPANQ
ncbi:MAG: hypothetical protein PHU93_04450 [Candidatus Gracilibacteria bacterium]|nr:hypothetical protein [Candidatus Gracilibacteria bacterium]